MRFKGNEEHEGMLIAATLKEAAELKLRKLTENRIRDDLEDVVKELTQQFIDEFKPQVEAVIYRDVCEMQSTLRVNITSTIKKEQQ